MKVLFLNCHRDVLQCGVINSCTYISGRQRAGYFNDPYQQAYADYAKLSTGQLSGRRHDICLVHRHQVRYDAIYNLPRRRDRSVSLHVCYRRRPSLGWCR